MLYCLVFGLCMIIGQEGVGVDLRIYLAGHYDHVAQRDFGGMKYGWSIRYRESSETLVTLFPDCCDYTSAN